MSRAAQRAQAAGPERFRAPVRAERPPVWKSLLAALLLMLVIIGLPVALLAVAGPPPIPTDLGMDTFTQAISVDALLGVLIWVIWWRPSPPFAAAASPGTSPSPAECRP